MEIVRGPNMVGECDVALTAALGDGNSPYRGSKFSAGFARACENLVVHFENTGKIVKRAVF